MKTLQIETGKQQYDLSGKVTVEFSPTDLAFVERLVSVFQAAEERQKDIEEKLKTADASTIFELARQWDAGMRELVNGVFDTDVCTPLFGGMNTFARCEGLPLWANLLVAILDECYDNLPKEDAVTKARIEKHTAKYRRAK